MEPLADEPNDSYAEAKILYRNDPASPRLSYLMVDDIDIWELCVTELPAITGFSATRPTTATADLGWNAVAGADTYWVYKDGALLTPGGITATSLTGVSVSGYLNAAVQAFSEAEGYSAPFPLIGQARRV